VRNVAQRKVELGEILLGTFEDKTVNICIVSNFKKIFFFLFFFIFFFIISSGMIADVFLLVVIDQKCSIDVNLKIKS